MERTLSIEEKIRKAEEIYNRRNNPHARIEKEIVNEPKNTFIKRKLKKIFIQMSICIIVYVILISTDFGGTFLSQDTSNYIKAFLMQDINFQELYKNVNGYIQSILPKEESSKENTENSPEQNNENNSEPNAENSPEQNNENSSEPSGENSTISNEAVKVEEDTTANIENIFPEDSIGGAVEVADVPQGYSNEQKTQTEIDVEYILNKVNFIKPVENYQISSRYGLRNPTTDTVPKNHTGIDLAAERGTKIISATDGTVILASSKGDYGNHLKIQIDDIVIIYAHCEKLYVEEGQQIYQGQEIAEVGSSGNSTGPHLHFEIRVDGRVIDPEYIVDFS